MGGAQRTGRYQVTRVSTPIEKAPEEVIPEAEKTVEEVVLEVAEMFAVETFEIEVNPVITDRFAHWANYQSTRVPPNTGIKLTLAKTRGEGPYSDQTFHTQMNLVLHGAKAPEYRKMYPNLIDMQLGKKEKRTQLFMTKDHRVSAENAQ